MPECRTCGVALDWHEHVWCRDCWYATEREDENDPITEPVSLSGSSVAPGENAAR